MHEKYIYWAAGVSGAAALIYQVVWSRALTNTTGATSYSFSILLAAFLAGLAIGGHYGGQYISDKKNALRVFGLLQLGIALSGATTLYIISNLSPAYAYIYYLLKGSFNAFTLLQAALVFLVMLIPTTLMGATFPVAVKAWSEHQEEVARNVGDIYSINTIGAVIGALLAGFILIPLGGLRSANLVANFLNLGVALVAFTSPVSRRLLSGAAAALVVVLSFAFVKTLPGLSFSYGLADHYVSFADFKSKTKTLKTVFSQDSAYGRVQVMAPEFNSGYLTLVNGGRLEGATGIDRMTQKLVVYLPLAVHKDPKTLLNIGLGTGTTVKVATEDSRLKSIDNVEINPAIYEAVDQYFYPGLFNSADVNAIYDDARHYLLITDRRYDVIVSQPSYPTSKGVSHLFTAEFYQIAARRLNKGGIFVQWLPAYLLEESQRNSAVKTLAVAFPNTYAWSNESADIMLVALKSGERVDPAKIKKQIDSLNDPDLGYWAFEVGPEEIAALRENPSVRANRDDLPMIEFAAAKSKVTRRVPK